MEVPVTAADENRFLPNAGKCVDPCDFVQPDDPGTFVDWHNAPRRQYVITLAGAVEIGLGDGSVHRFGPGEGILAEDLTGKGHTTRAVGNEPRITVTIPLAG